MKTATELSKIVGCEPMQTPWWSPIEIKFNTVHLGIVGKADRKTPSILEKVLEGQVEKRFFGTFKNVVHFAGLKSLFWVDTHNNFWLKRPSSGASLLAPDGVCFSQNPLGNFDARNVIGFNDNKASRNGIFTHDDRGKLIRYLAIIMEHYQKQRFEIGGSLFDGRFAQCFRLKRLKNIGPRSWKLECSTVMDCKYEVGAQLFAGFLCSKAAMGWFNDNLLDTCGDFLGSGSIGHVYKYKNDINCVVKVSRPECYYWLQKERENFLLLVDMQVNMEGLIQLSEHDSRDEKFLILTPILDPVCPWRHIPLNIEHLVQLVESTLLNIHNGGFVHCDLRPDNFMCDPSSGKWVLIDLGAMRKSSDLLLLEHGTLSFASKAVRSAYLTSSPIYINPKDDLESMVYVAYVMTWMTPAQVATDIFSLKGDLAQMSVLWEEMLSRVKGWSALLCSARSGNHHEVALQLRLLNQYC